jgi:hypothetical protein
MHGADTVMAVTERLPNSRLGNLIRTPHRWNIEDVIRFSELGRGPWRSVRAIGRCAVGSSKSCMSAIGPSRHPSRAKR